jgi:NAD+ kinase
MTMPLDLILVRHGQSEGNIAKRRSEGGDHTAFTPEFRERHTADFRLTDLGRTQAKAAGEFIKQEFLTKNPIDRHYVSEYVRARETAGIMQLPNARWFKDSYLTERSWGDVDAIPENEREEKFGAMLRRRDVQPFFWAPPNGETFNDLCMRVDRVLDTLHRECSDKRVLIVCHGEVMWAFRVRLERLSQEEFKELHLSRNPQDRIHNCQIFHYTRYEPRTNALSGAANWVRWARPAESTDWMPWERIERPRYTNAELLEEVHQVRQLVA